MAASIIRRGRDFRPFLIAMVAFGNRHFAPEGQASKSSMRRPASRQIPCSSTASLGARSCRRSSSSRPVPPRARAHGGGSRRAHAVFSLVSSHVSGERLWFGSNMEGCEICR